MQNIFGALASIHPMVAVLYGLSFVLGAAAPVVYSIAKKKPVSPSTIWHEAKAGDSLSRVVLFLWSAFVASSVFAIGAAIFR